MEKMIINGKDVAQGRVVKALEAMLNGADDATLRTMYCGKWDEQFYKIESDVLDFHYMVKKEFNCLIVWVSFCGGTSFNNGDEFVQRAYHPLCILDKQRDEEYQDVCRDLVNGLIRMRLLRSDEYIGPKYKED